MFSVMKYLTKAKIFSQISIFKRCVGSVVKDLELPKMRLKNEPILGYEKESQERMDLKKQLEIFANNVEDIPIFIGEKEFRPGCMKKQVMPSDHCHVIATYYYADSNLLETAIQTAVDAQKLWDKTTPKERFEIWERAADLMAGPYRQELNAATMLGQGKTVIQAEIDLAELIDFMRMHAYFFRKCLKYRPISDNIQITKNSMRYRGIEGFFAAICPFNFTAIGGNLALTPALMGNGVLWKPSDTAVLSNWIIFKIMLEAGLPPGVVNFVPADGSCFGETITSSPYLAGINFTGSVPTFTKLWSLVGENIYKYKNFPRLIGECGGKNFHFVHPSGDVESVVNGTIRSAFEYSGQKCSACSRMYVPSSLWSDIKAGLLCKQEEIKVGDVRDFSVFTSAVIDDRAFQRLKCAIEYGKENLELIAGGGYCNDMGYFIEPTIFKACDPCDKLMREELFGPVLTIFVYNDNDVKKMIDIVNNSTPYSLTGAVFAKDENFLACALENFKTAAGNFYINDKSTGSVVGQQPFGGARLSGTNDKAGGPHYILRFTSPLSIKETFVPLCDVNYSYMTTC